MLIIAEEKKALETIKLFQDFRLTFATSLEEAKFLLGKFEYKIIYCEPSQNIPNTRWEVLDTSVSRWLNKNSTFIFNCEEPTERIPLISLTSTFYSPSGSRTFSIENVLLQQQNCYDRPLLI